MHVRRGESEDERTQVYRRPASVDDDAEDYASRSGLIERRKLPRTHQSATAAVIGERVRPQTLERRRFSLELDVPDRALETVELELDGVVSVGRGSSNNVVVKDDSVSRTHFELSLEEPKGIRLRDRSLNGTRVNGIRVQGAWLKPGVEIAFGRSICRLRELQPEAVTGTASVTFGDLFGRSDVMLKAFNRLARFARTDDNVLISGESGTGKELAARAIHAASRRSERDYLVVDCGAMPEQYIESHLFGTNKGVFTDVAARLGVFELAAGGTVFIDEIGDLPLALQPRLLRVVQEREVTRLGEAKPRKVDVRIIAASHKNLRKMVAHKQFRLDLFQRLNELSIDMPPLRAREHDIVELAQRFLERRRRTDPAVPRLSPEAAEFLLDSVHAYEWPGNVRELEGCLKEAVVEADGGPIHPEHILLEQDEVRWSPAGPRDGGVFAHKHEVFPMPWKQVTRVLKARYLEALMRWVDDDIERAAAITGYNPRVLQDKLRELKDR